MRTIGDFLIYYSAHYWSFLHFLLCALLLPHQLHRGHDCTVQDAGNGPDEPAVLRLTVAVRAEGVEQENGGYGEPVDCADFAEKLGFTLVFAAP